MNFESFAISCHHHHIYTQLSAMPKEQIRKRGRRKPKTEDEYAAPKKVDEQTFSAPDVKEEAAPVPIAAQAGPSGLHPDRIALLAGGPRSAPPAPRAEGENGEGGGEGEGGQQPWGRTFGLVEEFPFGELDPDTKAYVKKEEAHIKDWEGSYDDSLGETREGESSKAAGCCKADS
jgi:nucleolar protein 9